MRFEGVFVESLVYELPPVEVTTASVEAELTPLYRRMGIAPGWLETVSGIRARRLWGPATRPSDGAVLAAERALAESGVDRGEVGLLISTSVCRDYVEPSTACLVHGKLGMHPGCMNFDIGSACLGFTAGMITAATMIESGRIGAALVVAGESSRQILEATVGRLKRPGATIESFKSELASLTLGSVAAAMVLTGERNHRQGPAFLGGAMVAATEHRDLCRGMENRMVTDAGKLLGAGVNLARETWPRFQDAVGWEVDQIREFALHQVGAAHHRSLLASLKLPQERAMEVYRDLGNVGAAGVPVTVARAVEAGRVRDGDKVAMLGIGSGLNCAMMGLQW